MSNDNVVVYFYLWIFCSFFFFTSAVWLLLEVDWFVVVVLLAIFFSFSSAADTRCHRPTHIRTSNAKMKSTKCVVSSEMKCSASLLIRAWGDKRYFECLRVFFSSFSFCGGVLWPSEALSFASIQSDKQMLKNNSVCFFSSILKWMSNRFVDTKSQVHAMPRRVYDFFALHWHTNLCLTPKWEKNTNLFIIFPMKAERWQQQQKHMRSKL